MVRRNPNFAKLQAGYLFPMIAAKKEKFGEENPKKKDSIISLGIGDTTQPLPPFITEQLTNAAKGLGTKEGYSGYPPWNGSKALREKIATEFYGNCGILLTCTINEYEVGNRNSGRNILQ
jgi:LL-diaminopimelate aminotransferase